MASSKKMTQLPASTEIEPKQQNVVAAMTESSLPEREEGREDENESVAIRSDQAASNKSRREYLPLAIFLLVFFMGTTGWGSLLPQYILNRLREKYFVNMTGTVKNSCGLNESNPLLEKERHVEQLTSEITSIAAFCKGVPAFITVLIYSSLSDQMGRKVTVAIPYVGGSLAAILIALLVLLELPFWVLYIAFFLNGLCGSEVTMVAGAFASIADVTSPERRSISIGILQGAMGLASLVANLLGGKWVAASGFQPPIAFLAALTVVSGVMFFKIRETNPRNGERMSPGQTIRSQWRHLKGMLFRDGQRAKKLCLLTSGFTFSEFVYSGSGSILTLYIMGRPLCMGSVAIGYYNAFKMAIVMIGTTIGIIFLRRVAKDLTLALAGMVSYILYFTFTGATSLLSGTAAKVFLGIGVPAGAISGLQLITIRAIASNEVSASEQGAVFGLIAIGDAFSGNFGPVVFSAIYAATVRSMTWFIFLLSDILSILALILIIIYWVIVKRNSFESLDEPVN